MIDVRVRPNPDWPGMVNLEFLDDRGRVTRRMHLVRENQVDMVLEGLTIAAVKKLQGHDVGQLFDRIGGGS